LTDVLIRGKPSQRFESFGKITSHQERAEMMFQVRVGLIIVSMNRGFFESSIHVLHLAIRPEMVSVGQPVGDGVFLTDACKDVLEGICILFSDL
jgi:hypothetical protein